MITSIDTINAFDKSQNSFIKKSVNTEKQKKSSIWQKASIEICSKYYTCWWKTEYIPLLVLSPCYQKQKYYVYSQYFYSTLYYNFLTVKSGEI